MGRGRSLVIGICIISRLVAGGQVTGARASHTVFLYRHGNRGRLRRAYRHVVLHFDHEVAASEQFECVAVKIGGHDELGEVNRIHRLAVGHQCFVFRVGAVVNVIKLVVQVEVPRAVRVHRQGEYGARAFARARRGNQGVVHAIFVFVRRLVAERLALGIQGRQVAFVQFQTEGHLFVRTICNQARQRAAHAARFVVRPSLAAAQIARGLVARVATHNCHAAFLYRRHDRLGLAGAYRHVVLHFDHEVAASEQFECVAVKIGGHDELGEVNRIHRLAVGHQCFVFRVGAVVNVIKLVVQVEVPRAVRVHRQGEYGARAFARARRGNQGVVHAIFVFVRRLVAERLALGIQGRQVAFVQFQTEGHLFVRTICNQARQRAAHAARFVVRPGLAAAEVAGGLVARVATHNRHAAFLHRRPDAAFATVREHRYVVNDVNYETAGCAYAVSVSIRCDDQRSKLNSKGVFVVFAIILMINLIELRERVVAVRSHLQREHCACVFTNPRSGRQRIGNAIAVGVAGSVGNRVTLRSQHGQRTGIAAEDAEGQRCIGARGKHR